MRIEWVQRRLENWAMWKERGGSGGLGFASQSIFADGPSARGTYDGAVIPVDEIDASITDDGVESLKLGHGHLYKTLQLVYLANLGIKGTAERMQRAESTVHHNLGQADLQLSLWFEERRRRPLAQREALNVRAQLQAGPAIAAHMEARDAKRAARRPPKVEPFAIPAFGAFGALALVMEDVTGKPSVAITRDGPGDAVQTPGRLVAVNAATHSPFPVPVACLVADEIQPARRRRPVLRISRRMATLSWPMGSMGEEV